MAAGAYHISPNGPRLCRASIQDCPYTEAGEPHFETQIEAQGFYEAKMSETFGTLTTVKREAKLHTENADVPFTVLDQSIGEKLRQASYRKRDALLNIVATVEASPEVQATLHTISQLEHTIPQLPRKTNAAIIRTAGVALDASGRAVVKGGSKMKKSFNKAFGSIIKRFKDWDARLDQYAVKAGEGANQRRQEMKALAAIAYSEESRLRIRPAYKLKEGDKISIDPDVYVAKVKDLGGAIRVQTRNAKGQLSHSRTYKDVASVGVIPAQSKRELRGQTPRQPKRLKDSTLYQRVTAASGVTKEAFQVLRGVDVSSNPRPVYPTRTKHAPKPFNERMRRSVASLNADAQDAHLGLSTVIGVNRMKDHRNLNMRAPSPLGRNTTSSQTAPVSATTA